MRSAARLRSISQPSLAKPGSHLQAMTIRSNVMRGARIEIPLLLEVRACVRMVLGFKGVPVYDIRLQTSSYSRRTAHRVLLF